MTSDALEDELTSINSIYGDETLMLIDKLARVCTLSLPGNPGITLRVGFPSNYPDGPPVILGTESIGSDVAKGAGAQAVVLARQLLDQSYLPGEPCIFALIDELSEHLPSQQQQVAKRKCEIDGDDAHHKLSEDLQNVLITAPLWTVATAIVEKKSIFLGRVASVTSTEQAKGFLQHYLSTDKKAGKATHNIVAWRIRGPDATTYQDCDDDGETAAGGRLLHLLQLMDVWNVIVVVTRWYGGIHLGPDRFRIINNAAREAIQLAGITKETPKKGR